MLKDEAVYIVISINGFQQTIFERVEWRRISLHWMGQIVRWQRECTCEFSWAFFCVSK